MKDFSKMKLREITKVTGMKSPSAGEFIRWSVALRPTNGETVNSQGAGSAQAPTNPHSNGRIK
jgi:hypothetical protein